MKLLPDYDLSLANTLGLPARARYFARVSHQDELASLAAQAELQPLPRKVLGGGSNLVLNGALDAVVLQAAGAGISVVGEDEQHVYVRAAAGSGWHELVLWTLQQGWSGLENLALIPGTVGAAPIQNIGAYGVELKDVLHRVEAWSLDGSAERTFSLQDCRFAYRDSIFKQEEAGRWFIHHVQLRLDKQWRPCTAYGDIGKELAAQGLTAGARQVAAAVMAVRQRKLPNPAQLGNAGSFFHNPIVDAEQYAALRQKHPQLVAYVQTDGRYKLAAGWLIEQAGWKGRDLGPVGMYRQQALVLVNHGGATAADVLALTQAVIADVAARFGVTLRPEPEFW